MARQSVTKTTASGKNPTAGVLLTWTAADTSNKEQFTATGKELILVWNTHATNAGTFTLNSVADERGRTGDITAQAIAAGAIYQIGPLDSVAGWQQTDATIHMEASATTIQWAVIVLK